MNSTTHFFDILLGIVVLQLDQRPLLHDLGASLCPDLYQFSFGHVSTLPAKSSLDRTLQRSLMDAPWTAPPDKVLHHFSVDSHTGLSPAQVRLHSERYGTNGACTNHVPCTRCADNGSQRKSFLRSQGHPFGSLSLSNSRTSLSSFFLGLPSYHSSWPCSNTKMTPRPSVPSWSPQ